MHWMLVMQKLGEVDVNGCQNHGNDRQHDPNFRLVRGPDHQHGDFGRYKISLVDGSHGTIKGGSDGSFIFIEHV